MFYIVYKITNSVNDKIYIGVHKTTNLDDGYLGSGTCIRRAVDKYGKENFTKEVLAFCNSSEEMYGLEEVLVTEEFVKHKNTYNIRQGGRGGWDHVNSNPELYKEAKMKGAIKGHERIKELWETDPEFVRKRKAVSSKVGIMMRDKGIGIFAPGVCYDRTGKLHSEDAKRKMRDTHKRNEHQQKEKNSQYGTRWISNFELKKCKKVKQEQVDCYLDNGWVVGSVFDFDLKSEREHKKELVDEFREFVSDERVELSEIKAKIILHAFILSDCVSLNEFSKTLNVTSSALFQYFKRNVPGYIETDVKKNGAKERLSELLNGQCVK